MTPNYVARSTWRAWEGGRGWTLEARIKEQWGAGKSDSEEWGDFVTEKERARQRGRSGSLVWMRVCLWRREGCGGTCPRCRVKKGSVKEQLNVKGHCWEWNSACWCRQTVCLSCTKEFRDTQRLSCQSRRQSEMEAVKEKSFQPPTSRFFLLVLMQTIGNLLGTPTHRANLRLVNRKICFASFHCVSNPVA